MRYSLVNGERIEALPKLSGKCHICGCQTIAKCGEIRVWHWAHKGQMCDPWYEKETEWHRTWQDCFPSDCHEVQQEKNGEKHIVDIKTHQGWAIKFQYRHLKSEQRLERSTFYEKLVWIVNGTRRDRDKAQFFKSLNSMTLVRMEKPCVWRVYLDECTILREWSGLPVPVFFDFEEETLWCLLSSSQSDYGYIVAFSRTGFINLHNERADHDKNFEYWLNQLNNLVAKYTRIQADMLKPHTSGLPMYLVKGVGLDVF